jgi:hypothetical protein
MDRSLSTWHDDVWVAQAPLRFYGIPVGTRMTVVRLQSGALWLHSPIRIDAVLERALRELGEVRFVVSPNKLHHLYLADAQVAFPEAELYAPPGLSRRRPNLRFEGELSDAPRRGWADEIDQLVVRGSSVMEEVVFLHRASRTLIVGDLCFYFGPESPWLTRLVARAAGMYDRPRLPPDWRWTFRRRAATQRSFERLLSWDYDRVILAHGRLIEAEAKEVFRRSYAWALK